MGLIKKVGTRIIGTPPADDDATRQIPGPPPDDGTRQIPGQAIPPAARPAPPDISAQGGEPRLTMHLLPGGTVLQGRYAIEEPIGVGGMSVVYRGRDLRFKDVMRLCAIKEMSQSAPDSQTRLFNLKNFEREAGMLATLQHPAIPKVYDFFEEGGRIYLVLELVPGKDLETVLEETGKPLDEAYVGKLALQICDVLSYLHNHKPEAIVFRDMKPSNVMVVGLDRVVLIDFGIAKNLNRSDRKGTMIGTEGYSPPEQYRGMAEPPGDIYALGATMHHLLTSSDPRLETPFTFQERQIRQLNPKISPEMEALINKALEYDMGARWQSVDEMKQALMSLPALGMAAPVAIGASPSGAAPSTARPASNQHKTEVIWTFSCEDEVRSSPTLHSGMLFVGSYDTNLYALDAARGEFRWKYATEGGVSSSPAVWQDVVLVGSEDGVLYCLELRKGQIRWKFRTEKAIRSSPRVEDRVVVFGSDDQHIYAVDGLRGGLIWKYRTWMPIRSSAGFANGNCYIGANDGHVYCLDLRNGNMKWKQRTQQPVVSSPSPHEGLVLVGSGDNNLYALDQEGGWPAWKYRTGHYVNSSPFILGNRVFFGGVDGNLYALDSKNGRLVWKFETGSQITSSPRVESGRVYFGAVDSFVYCLDAGSGQLIWKHQTEGPIVSSPFVADGVVYIGSFDHKVYALKA